MTQAKMRVFRMFCMVVTWWAAAGNGIAIAAVAEDANAGPPPAQGKSLNLLARVRLPSDSVSGDWKKTDDGYQTDSRDRARLRLGYRPEGEYDFRISFTRTESEEGVAQQLRFKGKGFLWVMGSYSNRKSGFGFVREKPPGDNWTTVPAESVLTNGKRHTAEVRVRSDSVSAYLDGELVRCMRTDYADLSCPADWDVGSDCLGIVTDSPAVVHSAEVVAIPSKENGTLKGSVKSFVTLKEKAASGAHQHLLDAIDRKAKKVRQADAHPDLKQLALKKIENDREAFAQSEKLPSCDELLDETIRFLDEYQVKVLGNVESTRLIRVDQTVRANAVPAQKPELAALEKRFERIVGGREQFTEKSLWTGSRFFPGRAEELFFYITDKVGDGFQGVVEQRGADGCKMKVEGFLHGNAFAMRTTSMIFGVNRDLMFTGYLLSDRMIANVSGQNPGNQPAVGSISLHKKK